MERTEIEELWEGMRTGLNEKQRRQYAATLATIYGRGGAKEVKAITGISLNTITAGKKELAKKKEMREKGELNESSEIGRVRKAGGGRKWVEEQHPKLQEYVGQIVDGSTYGSPEKPLSWTTESLRSIEQRLRCEHGIAVSHVTVGSILEDMGYSKQANQKMLQIGEAHPDRNAQFEYINQKASEFIAMGEPVISVDTKKKENIGNFKNNGQEYRNKKGPRKVLDHDFPIKELGKISPYGVYNLNYNTGFVNVGTSHDTAEFAVQSISRWWLTVGKNTFPHATKLLITCDCGGSNGYRLRLWKYQIHELAKRTGLTIHVSHFPPGTSKWNKVEHRLFCFISKNWQGKPLVSIETAVNLISSTTTAAGLSVICQRDDAVYPLAQSVSDEVFGALNIVKFSPFHTWNYSLS